MNIRNERMKLNLIEGAFLDGEFGFPILELANPVKIDKVQSFNYASSKPDYDAGLHFYLDDYQFERVWKAPDMYIDMFKKYKCVLGTDFSLFYDLPKALQVYNIYRNRTLDYYFMKNGVNIIPTVSWGDNTTYEWCFDGICLGSAVALSTVGSRKIDNGEMFRQGYEIMKEILTPTQIICVGKPYNFMKDDNVLVFNSFIENRGWK